MIRLVWDAVEHDADIELNDNIQTDDGLEAAVLISLFTDRLSDADDVIPDNSDDRRGYWGDAYADIEGDLIGSRLWLLERSKTTQTVENLAKQYAEEALAWMLEDGAARDVVVDVERQGDRLALRVEIQRPDETAPRWRQTWETYLGI